MELDAERLLSIVERIERIEEERKGLAEDIKEIYQEAKSANFDTKAISAIIKLRKKDEHERETEEYVLDCYKRALGI